MQNLDTSLPVPSVQELVRNGGLDAVPLRYIMDRDDHDHDHDSSEFDHRLAVPCIDMAHLLPAVSSFSSSVQQQSSELLKLRSASRDWGLFQIINHGVSQESLTQMRDVVQGFFELPLEEKKRWAQRSGSLEGYGQAFVTSEDQKLEWCDMIFLKALPANSRNLDLWPQNPPHFRSALEIYSEEMRQLAARLVKFLVMGLGIQQEIEKYSDAFNGGNFDVRMNCYPTCPEPEKVMGISPHADMSGITMLVECGDMPGLQASKTGSGSPFPL
ncbi:protein SRG1-like [Punica granatum]|uniref:Uncharacterized protein n=2 Tax=Punica granatum TaxID=22663 RepID=A0A218WDB4_PUNGR|nr:protein SRG1-like [Punica granatum]OWM70320.1 hypothetical protein CDL15_Pgr027222 [Punica granatum]PKI51407.1 hypothetical protein CRG98_028203 [Punica granatum]